MFTEFPILWALAGAYAVIASMLFLRARINYLRLPRLGAVEASKTPDCMVVIPARNEAAHIARAVQSFPHDTVIVVDDNSEDATAEEAKRAGAGVLKSTPLPRGAIGKAHACQAGADVLTSRWILFADADTWFEPHFLDRAVAAAEANSLDFLSIHPRISPHGFGEHLLAPYAVALFFCAVNPKASASAAFNGQCVLARREAYQFIGGHGALRKYLADDLHWAALADRHRMRYAVARSGPWGHMRFHVGALREGLTRDAHRFLEAGTGKGFLAMMAATFAAAWPLVSAGLWIGGERALAGAIAVLPMVWLAGWYRSWRVILAPIAVVALLPLMYRAMFAAVRGSTILWKGRTI